MPASDPIASASIAGLGEPFVSSSFSMGYSFRGKPSFDKIFRLSFLLPLSTSSSLVLSPNSSLQSTVTFVFSRLIRVVKQVTGNLNALLKFKLANALLLSYSALVVFHKILYFDYVIPFAKSLTVNLYHRLTVLSSAVLRANFSSKVVFERLLNFSEASMLMASSAVNFSRMLLLRSQDLLMRTFSLGGVGKLLTVRLGFDSKFAKTFVQNLSFMSNLSFARVLDYETLLKKLVSAAFSMRVNTMALILASKRQLYSFITKGVSDKLASYNFNRLVLLETSGNYSFMSNLLTAKMLMVSFTTKLGDFVSAGLNYFSLLRVEHSIVSHGQRFSKVAIKKPLSFFVIYKAVIGKLLSYNISPKRVVASIITVLSFVKAREVLHSDEDVIFKVKSRRTKWIIK